MTSITTTDGTVLAVTEWEGAGGNRRTAVFCHSWAVNQDQFDYLVPGLVAAGVRCVTYDRRFHGRSARRGPLDLDTFADDLAAVIEALDLSDITLVGHSFGCAEVIRFITRHGTERVARVVMLAPMLPFMVQTDDNPAGVPLAYIEASIARLAGDVGGWCEDNRAPFFGVDPTVSESMKDWVSRQIQSTPVHVLVEVMRLGATTDLRKEVAKLDVATLIVHGDADASTPLGLTGRRVFDLLPDGQLVVVPGAGHGLYASHAPRIVEELIAVTR